MVFRQDSCRARSAAAFVSAIFSQPTPENIVRLLFAVLLAPFFALPLLLHLPAIAQNGSPKDFHFEVLSIRPVDGSPYTLGPRVGKTDPDPDGFRSVLTAGQMLAVAYSATNSNFVGAPQMLNAPGWFGQFYDIAAKVSQSDLRVWQHKGPAHELLRAALRSALRERFKLAIHEQPSKGDIFELVVAKGGARLKPTVPAHDPWPPGRTEANRPDGGGMVQTVENGKQVKTYYDKDPGGVVMVLTIEHGRPVRTLYERLPGGGVLQAREDNDTRQIWENGGRVTTYYNATMEDLTNRLSNAAGVPVRDKTGLSGRYDFTITSLPRDPDENAIYRYPLKHLGLAVEPGTEQRPTLVIDHIERPSRN